MKIKRSHGSRSSIHSLKILFVAETLSLRKDHFSHFANSIEKTLIMVDEPLNAKLLGLILEKSISHYD